MLTPHLHIKLFNRKISSFHFFGIAGFIAGTLLGVLLCYFLGLDIGIILLMSATGAATFFLLALLSKLITGGETIVYYHHEIAILVACSVVLNALGYPVLPYLDITLLGIGTFLGFGRIGCFSVGCCHGRPYHHGVKYNEQHVKAGFTWYYNGITLLPVQLIESCYVFLTVGAGILLLFNQVAPGTVMLCYTVIYGMMRYVLEFFRGDPDRPLWQGVSEAQWTTLILVSVTFGMSYIGWLPFYNWHLVIFIILCMATLAVIIFYNRNEEYALFSASHIRELAQGVHSLEAVNSFTENYGDGVNTFTTRRGLYLSCGKHSEGNVTVDHYTISTNDNRRIRYGSVKRMARLISVLKNYDGRVDLIDKQNGVYHILFTK